MFVRVCLSLAFFTMMPVVVTADEPVVLQAAYVEFPPLTFTDENGQPAGSYIALSNELAKAAGYQLEWQNLPIGRIYVFLEMGRIDFWPGVAGLPHLQASVIESAHTLTQLSLSAFHMPGTPPVDDFDALRAASLIVIRGYTYLGALDRLREDPATNFYTAPGHEEGLRMLSLGRGSYLLDYEEPMAEAKKHFPGLIIESSPLLKSRLAYIVSRKTNKAAEVIRRFDSAYADKLRTGFVLDPVQ